MGSHTIGAGLDAIRTVRIDSVEPIEGAKKLSRVMVHDGQGPSDRLWRTKCAGCRGANRKYSRPRGGYAGWSRDSRSGDPWVASAGMLASQKELGLP